MKPKGFYTKLDFEGAHFLGSLWESGIRKYPKIQWIARTVFPSPWRMLRRCIRCCCHLLWISSPSMQLGRCICSMGSLGNLPTESRWVQYFIDRLFFISMRTSNHQIDWYCDCFFLVIKLGTVPQSNFGCYYKHNQDPCLYEELAAFFFQWN